MLRRRCSHRCKLSFPSATCWGSYFLLKVLYSQKGLTSVIAADRFKAIWPNWLQVVVDKETDLIGMSSPAIASIVSLILLKPRCCLRKSSPSSNADAHQPRILRSSSASGGVRSDFSLTF